MFLKKNVDVLGFFDVEQLKRVTPDIIHNKYKAGQFVVMKGEITSSFYIIKNGSVLIYTKEDPKNPRATLQKGDFFGVMSMFSNLAHDVTIKAGQDMTEVLEIPSQSFQKLLEMQPLLKETLIKKVQERLGQSTAAPATPPPQTPPAA